MNSMSSGSILFLSARFHLLFDHYSFPKMMMWLQDVRDGKETKANDVAIDAIVKHFGKNWRDNVEKINNSVLKNFDEKEPGG
jgi:hypothetical protein